MFFSEKKITDPRFYEINLNKRRINYELKTSRRSRCLRLTIHPGGQLIVTIPFFTNPKKIEDLLRKKSDWILKNILRLEKNKIASLPHASRKDYQAKKEVARKLVFEKIYHFNRHYKLNFNKVSIRNQKTRWGSCSKSGNLNFNYRIVYLPEKLADYLVIHELCHLKEHNHGSKFWELVASALPENRILRKELRRYVS
jgi:predicted metal-dependent hydrolase